jgi:hypothetical protein
MILLLIEENCKILRNRHLLISGNILSAIRTENSPCTTAILVNCRYQTPIAAANIAPGKVSPQSQQSIVSRLLIIGPAPETHPVLRRHFGMVLSRVFADIARALRLQLLKCAYTSNRPATIGSIV